MPADGAPSAPASSTGSAGAPEAFTSRSLWEQWGSVNLGLFTAALVLATWPLWWGGTDFSVIPWSGWLVGVPLAVDRGLVVALLGGAAAAVLAPQRGGRTGLAVLLASLGFLVLLDQHRFQPWAWLMLLETLAVLALPARTAQRWIRWIIISLYVWSAVSKLDAAFLTGRGPWLLTGLLDGLGLETVLIPPQRLARAAWLLPLGELAAAAALAFGRTRRLGRLLAVGMHAALLVALGPWGHDHHLGVLLWNAFFLIQTPLLFGRDASDDSVLSVAHRSPPKEILAKGILAATIAAPALEPWGLWDHWPAWAVYSDRPEVVRMWVSESALEALPQGLPSAPPLPLSDLCELRFDEWSFGTQRSPVYPQARYKLALALAVAERLPPAAAIRVTVEATPDRWSGKRSSRELLGRDSLRRACDEFLLNTRARGTSPPSPTPALPPAASGT